MEGRDELVWQRACQWVVESHDYSFTRDSRARAELAAWLNQSETHRSEYLHAAQTLRRVELLSDYPQLDFAGRLRSYVRSVQEHSRRGLSWRLVLVMAALFVFLGVRVASG